MFNSYTINYIFFQLKLHNNNNIFCGSNCQYISLRIRNDNIINCMLLSFIFGMFNIILTLQTKN